jgi:hypothetical protein
MKLYWRKVILYLATAMMELCWIYALVALMNGKGIPENLSIISLITAYPIAFGTSLILHRLKLHRIARRAISWLIWLIVLLLMLKLLLYGGTAWADSAWLLAIPRAVGQIFTVFRAELLIVIGTIILWWFGSRLAGLKMNFRTLVIEFQFGLPLLLVFFIIAFLLDINIGSIPLALLFFFFALLGLSISHAQEGSVWLSGIYRGHWAGLLIISITVVLGLGLLIGLLINHNFIQLILTGLNWVWDIVTKVISWLVSLFPAEQPSPVEPPVLPVTPTNPGEGTEYSRLPEQVRKIIGGGVVLVLLVLCLVALWRTATLIYNRLTKRAVSNVEIETLRGGFKADLFRLLRWLAKVFKIKLSRKQKSVRPEVITVRHLYRQLLHWTITKGLPRKSSQTPDEYLAILTNRLPEVSSDLSNITRLYNGVRYGRQIPKENEIKELKRNWQRIKLVQTSRPVVEPVSA